MAERFVAAAEQCVSQKVGRPQHRCEKTEAKQPRHVLPVGGNETHDGKANQHCRQYSQRTRQTDATAARGNVRPDRPLGLSADPSSRLPALEIFHEPALIAPHFRFFLRRITGCKLPIRR